MCSYVQMCMLVCTHVPVSYCYVCEHMHVYVCVCVLANVCFIYLHMYVYVNNDNKHDQSEHHIVCVVSMFMCVCEYI